MDLEWWKNLSPWVQGLFGGAGVTLLWEGLLKPTRDRRSLARVLASEISINIQYAAGQRLYLNHNPSGIPSDFAMSDAVFEATAARIGDLPPNVIGEVVLLYGGLRDLNRIPASFALALREFRSKSGPDQKVVQMELDSHFGVYRTSLEKFVERANVLLPKLHRIATPWFRIDLRLKKKRVLTLEDLARDVAGLAKLRASYTRPDDRSG